MSCIHQNAEVILEAFIARIRTAGTFKEIKNVQIYQNTLNAQGDITKYRKVLEEIFKETYPALKNVEDIFIVEENTSSLALNISPEFSKVYEDIFTNKLLKEKAEYDKKGYKNGNFTIFKNIDTVPFLLAADEFRALEGQSFRDRSGRVTKEFVRDYSNSSAALEKLRRKFGRSNVEYSKTFKDGMYVNKVIVYSPVLETYTSSNKQLSLFLSPEVKEGVSELFESNVQYQLPQDREIEEFVASEKTIRDLAARMSDRIGIPVRYISDRSQQFKGKLENGTAVVNLAYATLDTPIHEILGHPIIRAIKNRDKILSYNEWVEINTAPEMQGLDIDISREAYDKYVNWRNNTSKLYQNLLKELEYGKGKEVFDRIKRDYVVKNIPEIIELEPIDTQLGWGKEYEILGKSFDTKKEALDYQKEQTKYYTLEEQQEEALVELLGLYTAGRLDKVKDGKLISLLKRLLKEMKQFVRSLLNQKEVEIDKLPDNMTLGDIADLLAYSNSKIILPGNEVVYTTPDNQQFKTYQEASNHISELAKSVEDVDLNDIRLENKLSQEDLRRIEELENQKKEKEDYFGSEKYKQDKDSELHKLNKRLEELKNKKVEFHSQEPYLDLEDKEKYGFQDFDYIRVESTYGRGNKYHKDSLGENYEGYYIHGYNTVKGKPENKILPITKEQAIKIWEKDESSKYEVADRQEIFRIEDSIRYLQEDSKIKYEISDIEREIRKIKEGQNTIQSFIEKNKEYEQSKEIIEEWKKVNDIQYNPEEVYSRGQEFVSVVGAYSDFDVNLMMQNLLQHIEDNQKAGGEFTISAFTKPVDKTIGHLEGGGGKIKFKIYPQSQDIKWAANTDVYSGSVWDASEKVSKDKKSELLGVSYTKYPSLQNVNEVQPNLASIIDNLAYHHNELGISLTGSNFRLEYDENIPYSTKKLINSINSILDQKYGKLVKPEIKKGKIEKYKVNSSEYFEGEVITTEKYFDTLKEAEDFVEKRKVFNGEVNNTIEIIKGVQPTQTNETLKENIDSVSEKIGKDVYHIQLNSHSGKYVIYGSMGVRAFSENFNSEKEAQDFLDKKYPKKEYTEQALINAKIAKLKEVAKKYPRSLIRSEVRPISNNSNLGFVGDELPFQKAFAEGNKTKKGVQELFESNSELANSVYSKLLTNSGISAENLLSLLEKENIVEKDCTGGGKLKAKDGIATLFEKGGKWEIVTDFKNAPTHKSGGKDVSIQGKKVEVEKNELRIENDFGDVAVIPSKYRVEVQDAVKSNCHSCIDGIVESLPKMKDYAGDGTVFPFFGRYKRFKNSLPDNLKNTPEDDYAMRYYWKHNNKPKSFDEAINREQPMFTMGDDGYYHAPSVEPNTLRFLKPKNHPTLQYELDWYNSDNSDAVDFRSRYDLDMSGKFYKYVPKKQ